MRRLYSLVLAGCAFALAQSGPSLAQTGAAPAQPAAPAAAAQPATPAVPLPTVQELSFLIGTWDRAFDFRDTHNPERGITFSESGVQTCRFGLQLADTPMYIICEGELTATSGPRKGRRRQMVEYIRYNRFIGAFDRVGHFSNWPTRTYERWFYRPDQRAIEIRGELVIQNGVIERYEEFYRFNEDKSAYTMRNVANFSDIPVTQFNLIYEGTAKKRQ